MKKTIKLITLSILIANIPSIAYAKKASIFGALIGGVAGNAVAKEVTSNQSEAEKIKILNIASSKANSTAPQQIDEYTTFVHSKVLINPTIMIYQYKLNFLKNDIKDVRGLNTYIFNNTKISTCNSLVLKHDINVRYEYYGSDSNFITYVDFNKNNCQ